MKKKFYLSLLALFASVGIIFAQTRVSGVVQDENGEPIVGASILIKGTEQGTISDADGNFSLTAPSGARLVISYVGYKTKEVMATARMQIRLEVDSELLEEVVVVGYGSQKKANLTGAVATVNVEEAFASRPIADVGRGLQGTVSGLSVVVPSGEVGSDPIMKIRGQVGSISGSSIPLILVDNVEVPSIQ